MIAFFYSAYCDRLSSGKARLVFDANVEDYCAIAVTALDATKWDNLDGINADHEAVRIAASCGVKALQSLVSSEKGHIIIYVITLLIYHTAKFCMHKKFLSLFSHCIVSSILIESYPHY